MSDQSPIQPSESIAEMIAGPDGSTNESCERYRIVPSPYFSQARLARAKPYSRIEDAVADMGDGLVIADDGHIAAFHERHEPAVAALSATLTRTS